MKRGYCRAWLAAALVIGVAVPAVCQEPQESPPDDATSELAKQAQNPVANMISVPFQYNLNIGVERYELDGNLPFRRWLTRRILSRSTDPSGTLRVRFRSRLLRGAVKKYDRNQSILNIQPVIPFTVGNVNIINRVIMPVMYQPIGKSDEEIGLGDINWTMFFSPAKPGKVIWGVGPIVSFPTATDDALGTDKWSAGPSVVVLTMPGRWVVGGLASNMWSFAGDSDAPDVNQFLLQPFINYNFDAGWYASFSPIITANWEADSGERWTVPVGGGVGRVFTVGKQPVNASLAAYYNVEKPETAADWSLRFQLTFLFPTG